MFFMQILTQGMKTKTTLRIEVAKIQNNLDEVFTSFGPIHFVIEKTLIFMLTVFQLIQTRRLGYFV